MTILMLIVSLCEYLRDVTCTWVDILKLGAYAAASEFCEWVQARTNVCIPHCKYQVKSHLSPWFSPGCAAIALRNHFFHFCQQNKSSESKVKFSRLVMDNVLNKGKSAILSLFNDPGELSSASHTANC